MVTSAVISLGTNTIRLLIVRRSGDRVEQIRNEQTGTRLGEGLRDTGSLSLAAKERTLAAVETFAAIARSHEAKLSCIATSAMRRASDADAFARDLYAATGADLQILDGPTEAAASFCGATYDLPRDTSRVAVLDIGGGSTECAIGRDRTVEDARSIEIGSVRFTERYADLSGNAPGEKSRSAASRARSEIAEMLAPLRELGRIDRLIAVAGTALTLGAIANASDVDSVSGQTLSLDTIDATIERLLDLSLQERRVLPGMLPQRADVLACGGLILSETLRLFGVAEAHLEANDLLLGFLLADARANSWDGRGSNPDALAGGKF